MPDRSRGAWRELACATLAVLLSLLVLDAAVETFGSGSPMRWIVIGTVATYLTITLALGRRLGWTARATLSLLVLLGLLTFTAWWPQGFSRGPVLLRQPTVRLCWPPSRPWLSWSPRFRS